MSILTVQCVQCSNVRKLHRKKKKFKKTDGQTSRQRWATVVGGKRIGVVGCFVSVAHKLRGKKKKKRLYTNYKIYVWVVFFLTLDFTIFFFFFGQNTIYVSNVKNVSLACLKAGGLISNSFV